DHRRDDGRRYPESHLLDLLHRQVAGRVTSPAISVERVEIRAMARLAAPLVLAEVGWMMMGVVDTMVVGRVSADAIGAVSLGTSIFYTIAIFASGLLLGLDTMIAQAFGAGDSNDCRHSLINGTWLALFLIAPVMLAVDL